MINALQVLFPKLPCDPFRDFLPVTQLVNASHPWKEMRDVVEAAKAQPMHHATFAHGSTAHMYGELLNLNTGTKLQHIGYKDSGPALPEVPTFAEAGYPGFEVVGWFGAFAAAGTPRPIIV